MTKHDRSLLVFETLVLEWKLEQIDKMTQEQTTYVINRLTSLYNQLAEMNDNKVKVA